MGLLLSLLPESSWVLVIAGAGIVLMLGLRQKALGLLGGVVLLAFLIPFADAAFGSLVPGLQLLLLAAVVLILLRSLFNLLPGRGATSHLISALFLGLLRLPFRILWALLRPRRSMR